MRRGSPKFTAAERRRMRLSQQARSTVRQERFIAAPPFEEAGRQNGSPVARLIGALVGLIVIAAIILILGMAGFDLTEIRFGAFLSD